MKPATSRRVLGVLLALCAFISLFTTTHTAESQVFALISYEYKSSAGTEEIYPGSRNVVLTVNVKYSGSSQVYVSAGCINLPEGFATTYTYSSCAPPESASGEVSHYVQPGDVVVFTYHLDVSRNAAPGVYGASVTIHYRDESGSYSENITGIQITVSEYPPLSLQVVDWYWSPAGYPGSENVYLYVTLRNTGDSRVLEASGVAKFSEEVFTPPTVRFRLSNLEEGRLASIALGPVSVYPSADPNTPYRVLLEVNATMSTDDGVSYYDYRVVEFSVTLTRPPLIRLEVLDYGLEAPKPVSGLRQARFYIVLVNKDFKTIRSVTAYYTIKSPGASFTNGSRTDLVVYQGVVDYGGVFSLYSGPIVISESTRYMEVETRLVVFGDDNGAEFWSVLDYVFNASLALPSIDLGVVSAYWSRGEVYPGTEGATLNIVLVNRDVVDVRDAVVTAKFPRGFYPGLLAISDVAVQRGSMTTITFQGISVNTSTSPGEYPVHLAVSGVAYDPASNTYYEFTVNYTVTVTVSEPPILRVVNLTSHGWIGERVYTTSVNAAFYAYMQVTAPGHVIRGLRVTALLPPQMIFTSGGRERVVTVEGIYRYGDHIYVEFSGVSIATSEGNYYPVVLIVEGLAESAANYWFTEYYTILLPVLRPLLNLTLVDASWTTSPISSGTSGAGLQVTFQSYSLDTISSIVARIVLHNAVFSTGRNYSVVAIQRPVNYGEVFTLEFTGIEVNTSTLTATIEVVSVLSTAGTSYYSAVEVYTIAVSALEELRAFRVINIHTSIMGEYAPLLPSSRGVTVTIELANTKPYPVAWVEVEVSAPPEIRVNDVAGTCSGGVVAGGVCTVSLSVDVAPSATPGAKSLVLVLVYAVRSGQALSVFTESHTVSVVVADYEYYKPKLALVSAYWGVQAPIRALAGQRNVPLTVVVLNRGYYPVDGVYVEAAPLNSSVVMVLGTATCAPRLASSAYCTATLYADLSSVNTTSLVVFEVRVNYAFTLYNTLIGDSERFTVTLLIEEAASGRGLLVVDASWINNWPVYPETENATLQVTLANLWPYRVSGVQLELELPSGFSSKTGARALAYVPGPVNSLQEIIGRFTLTVGGVKPGLYTAKLRATYVVETGTPNTRVVEEYTITLLVNNPEGSIWVVSTEWVGRVPEPPEYGAVLMVSVRSNANPSMRGVVLEVELPEGFLDSNTNTSHTSTPASSVNIVREVQRVFTELREQPAPLQVVQALLSQITTQAAPSGTFTYGDVMYFYLKLNIVTEKRGVFTFRGYLNFIDHWNNVRHVPVSFNVTLLGSTKLVRVEAPLSLRVERGVATLRVGLVNTGSAPLYNVYAYLVPYSAMLLPQDAVKYIGTLPPGELVHVNYTLVYNPFAVATSGVQAYLRYMSAPFTLTLLYRDACGNMYYYNTTLAVLIEPFIDLGVANLKSVLRNSVLSVSGVVVNYGIATARSVVVRAVYANYTSETLLGDVDPASQVAFRLELSVREAAEDYVQLVVEYRDEYGRVERLNYNSTLTRVEHTAPPSPAGPTTETHSAYITVTVVVAAFLAGAALMMYRYLRAHSARLVRG